MTERIVLSDDDDSLKEAPIRIIDAISRGAGAIIEIAPNTPQDKVMWSLKMMAVAVGINYQWLIIKALMTNGMSFEHAEAQITTHLNKLLEGEIPPLPTGEEIEELERKYGDLVRRELEEDEE